MGLGDHNFEVASLWSPLQVTFEFSKLGWRGSSDDETAFTCFQTIRSVYCIFFYLQCV